METHNPIIARFKNNPILTAKDVPYPVATVHNAGIVKHNDRYIMLFRSHLLNGRSIIGRADSEDGFSFTVHPKPFLVPSTDNVFAEYEAFGVEDMRISLVEDEYLLTYSAYSCHGVRIALARTMNFNKVDRIALITQADLRNVVIFPEKFGERYVRLDRPHSEISSWSIWISYSPDLVHWGDSRVIMKPVAYHWDEMKIGPGAPPFKTDNRPSKPTRAGFIFTMAFLKPCPERCIASARPCMTLMIRQTSLAFPISGYCSPRILGR